jgi:hypothetical protein
MNSHGWVAAALFFAIAVALIVITTHSAGAGVTCTTYGGKGPGGWRWSQTTCR